MPNVEKLNWDSNFFSLSIGRLDLTNGVQTISINELKDFDLEFDLIYLFSKEKLYDKSLQYEDCKVTLSYSADSGLVEDSNVFSYNEGMQESLLSLALQSGEYSRFKLDSNFKPDVFPRLYQEWLRASLDNVISDEVYSFNDSEGLPIGFITLVKKGNYCEIGLLAVSKSSRGQGVGKKLIQKAINYTVNQGCKELRVPTQKRNADALEFYKKMNFKVIDETYIYHYWCKL